MCIYIMPIRVIFEGLLVKPLRLRYNDAIQFKKAPNDT